jgi:putative DNA primase/helicase
LANQIRDHVKVFEDQSLDNRAGDNWEPLFAIASAAGEEWLKETMLAAQRMCRKDAQEMKSFGRYLLESLDRIIKAKREKLKLDPTERIFLKTLDLVNELNQDDEAPWKDSKFGELTARGLSKGLGGFEIRHRLKKYTKPSPAGTRRNILAASAEDGSLNRAKSCEDSERSILTIRD